MSEQRLPSPVTGRVRDLLRTEHIKRRFDEVLKDRAPQFLASLGQLVFSTPGMDECEPQSVFAAALTAAALDLAIDKNLGQAWIIPYNSKRGKQAQFQMGWKGYVQLALRTAQYRTINVTETYEGEVTFNRLTGQFSFGERKSDKIAGYFAYFELLSGFSKALYMTVAEVEKHRDRFAKGLDKPDSAWKTNFDGMAKKTVIKALISKWGVLSIQMQKAIAAEIPPEEQPEPDVAKMTKEEMDKAREALFGKDEDSSNGNGHNPLRPTEAQLNAWHLLEAEADNFNVKYAPINEETVTGEQLAKSILGLRADINVEMDRLSAE